MQRVLVIGSGGSGKTTLALRIGDITGLPVIHLDSLYWRPGWVETPPEEWQQVVSAIVEQPRWVMDGNYGGTLDTRIASADAVVFLDVPRVTCIWRLFKRRFTYAGSARPSVAPGCPERLPLQFLRWVWTYPTRRRGGILARLEEIRASKSVVILRKSRDVERYLAELSRQRR